MSSFLLVTGIYAGMRPQEELRTAELLRSLQFYPVTFPIVGLTGVLKRDHARRMKDLALYPLAGSQ
jgi:hypothetical protein